MQSVPQRLATLGPRILPTTASDSHLLSDSRDERVVFIRTESILIVLNAVWKNETGKYRTCLTDNIENK